MKPLVKKPDSHPDTREFILSVLNSYSQIFFSDNWVFGLLLLVTTFLFPLAGLAGLTGVLLANITAFFLGFDRKKTMKGLWGYNVLLTTLPLGLFFEPGIPFWVLTAIVSILTLMVTIAIQGVLHKYQLPFLSLPFVLVMWILILSTRQFDALQISRQSIYQLNELYGIGGTWLVGVYEWFQNLDVGRYLHTYLASLSAIFFQNSLAGGVLIAIGLLIASRISFVLSIVGFSAAFGFYELMGTGISEADYIYIGFNFMLTAIAVGGFYNIPTAVSYWWVILLTPIVVILTTGLSSVLNIWQLSVYSMPFNLTSILFIYILKWRYTAGKGLVETPVQRNSPEKNLYAWVTYRRRFGKQTQFQIALPFWGEWMVSQGHDGDITHRDDWRHAWDFVQTGKDGKTYRMPGTALSDFLAFDKPVLAPADGYVTEVVDGIPDNPIGQVNLKNNWGNTVIIRIGTDLYAKISHFRKGSIQVRAGDWVSKGSQLGTCGNSGRSPEPHIHFQLQQTPYVDSRTLAYPLAYYLSRGSDQLVSNSYRVPMQGDYVRNPEPVPMLKKVLDFVPGQTMELDFTIGNLSRKAEWEIKTTPYNEPYIQCRTSGAKAYYQNDGQVFSFVHFEGARKSPLYLFYLALFQRPLFYGDKTLITDQIPPNRVFSGLTLVFQDFMAPFMLYLKAGFETNLPDKLDLFADDNIRIESKVSLSAFDTIIKRWTFRIGLENGEMNLKGSVGNQNFSLTWIRNS